MNKGIILFLAFLTSCTNPKHNTESAFSLEGTWVCDDTYYRLHSDGTGVVGDSIESDSIISWKYDGKVLSYAIEEDPNEKAEVNVSIRSDNTIMIDQSYSFRREDDN